MWKFVKKVIAWFKGRSYKGLYMRLTVTFCISYIVHITERTLKICETTQISPAPIYVAAVGFFGTELGMLLVKKLHEKKESSKPTNKIKDGFKLPVD